MANGLTPAPEIPAYRFTHTNLNFFIPPGQIQWLGW